jgi:hypothetical protein
MQYMEHKSNLKLINDLVDLLKSEELFQRIEEEGVQWYILFEFEQGLVTLTKLINEKYSEIYSNSLIPILQNQEDLICLYKGKYLWIHLASPGWERRGEYDTAEDVWNRKIKKDIEQYYND